MLCQGDKRHRMAATPRLRTAAPSIPLANLSLVPPAPKVADPFYQSVEWVTLMARLKTDRKGRCEHCQRGNTRLFGDHIVELKDGGDRLDPRNVQLLCGACHTTKTVAARARRMATPASVARRQQTPGGAVKS
jgi:5-methylcytosine-specific restriction protein A